MSAERTYIKGLVSVIIPTYNHAKFIEQTIASVVSQTYTDMEILVLDDGSTDDAPTLIEAWAARDSRIVAMLSERNLGFSANVNHGLTAARGEFIAKLDGDDLMYPHKIATQVAFLQNHPEYVLTHHNMEAFDSDTGSKLYLLTDKGPMAKHPADWCFFTNWSFGNKAGRFVYSSVLARTTYLTQHLWDVRVPYKNEVLHVIENYACMPSGKWYVFDEPLGRYRVISNSMSRSKKSPTYLLQENNVMCGIALAKHPKLARQIISRRDYYLFSHLLYNKLPHKDLKYYFKIFLKDAGFVRFTYLVLCKALIKLRLLFLIQKPSSFLHQ